MGNGAALAISNRSWSPVTKTSDRPSSAEARIQASSGSRAGMDAGFWGLGTTSCPWSKSRMSRIVPAGNLKRLASTSRSSSRTTSPVINWCSARTYRTRSAHSPRVANAAARTLVSRNTLTTHPASHPHQSDSHGLRQRVGSVDGCPRIDARTARAGARRGQYHSVVARCAYTGGPGAVRGLCPSGS